MGLVSVALDLAQSLRRSSHAKAGGDPFAAIPTALIQSLLHKTDIARAEISLHALESACELKKIVRGTGSMSHACCARESFDLLFTSPHGGPSSGPLTVGKIAFSLSRSVSTDERYALGVFATFLADHVATALISFAEAKCLKATSRIAAYFQQVDEPRSTVPLDVHAYYEDDDIEAKLTYAVDDRRARAGSVINKILRVLSAALKPFGCYFCVLFGRSVIVEYSESRHRSVERRSQVLSRHHPYAPHSSLARHLSQGKVFVLREPPFEDGPCYLDETRWVFVVAPIVVSKSVIGMILVQYDSAKVFLLSPVADLLERTAFLVRNQARYLFQRRFQRLVINPYFKGRETRVDERKIFVLMPYSEAWSDRTYRVLKQTIEDVGFVSQRADDLFNQNVMEDVWSGILSARFVLADITARNPNVFYELGIAHTLGKDGILITQNVADIPFDLQGHRCIVYSDNIDGCEKLKFELSVQLKNRSQM